MERSPVGRAGLGIRAGYVFAPYTANWRLGGRAIDGRPDASFEGRFARLLILSEPRGGGR